MQNSVVHSNESVYRKSGRLGLEQVQSVSYKPEVSTTPHGDFQGLSHTNET